MQFALQSFSSCKFLQLRVLDFWISLMTYDVLSSSLHSLVKVAMQYRLHRPGGNLAVVVVQVPFIEYLRRYFSWSNFLWLEVLDF